MTSVGALIRVGLIETIRARGGRLPWLGRHLERLRSSAAALGLTPPPSDLGDLIRTSVGPGDRVVRLELRGGSAEITTRGITHEASLSVVVSHEIHQPYPHKTTQREPFGRALVGA
ncbi:MAG TPA: aminotransferase class IV, partial [Gemmatimonadales bacterium]|nr:aminotransferase class IV [Gemmatimonadales bacterium]